MKENIEFDYLVIIDLWNVDKLKEMGNPLALPNNIDVYESMNKVLLNNLDFFSFKNIIISNGNLGGLRDRGWIEPERNVRNYLNSFNKSNTFICGTRNEFYYHNENKEESVRSNTSDIDNDDINYSIESVNNNDNDIIRPIDKNDKNEDKSKKNTKTISKKNTKTKTNSKCEQYDKKIPKGEVAKLVMEKTVKKGGKVKFPKNQEQVEEESESEDD